MKIAKILLPLILALAMLFLSSCETELDPSLTVICGDQIISPVRSEMGIQANTDPEYDSYYEFVFPPSDIPRIKLTDDVELKFASKHGSVNSAQVYDFYIHPSIYYQDVYRRWDGIYSSDDFWDLKPGVWYIELRTEYKYGLARVGFDVGERYYETFLFAVEVE